MEKKSKLFKRICYAGMMFIALSTISCSNSTCDMINERPPIVHQLSVGKNCLFVEQVCDMIMPNKHPVYASMAGAGDFDEFGEYEEIESDGIFDTLINILLKFVLGVFAFFAATFYLWWNELRYLRKKHTLEEVDKRCIIMENPNTKDASMEGKLVSATATASTEEILSDPDFGIEINAISLSREVQYYQWVEEKETKESFKNGKTIKRTIYKYKKQWVSDPIDSAWFQNPDYQDRNFVIVEIEDKKQWAKKVSFGAYILNDELKEFMVSEPLNLELDDKILEKWNNLVANSLGKATQDYQGKATDTFTGSLITTGNEAQNQEQELTVSGEEVPSPQKKYDYVHQDKNKLYFGKEPSKPSIGDVSIYFKKVLEGTVTVVSQVCGDSFIPYESRVEQNYQKLVMGESNDDLIIEEETEKNKKILWKFRFLASGVTCVGLFISFNILSPILLFLFSFSPHITKFLQYFFNFTDILLLIACLIVGIVWSVINIILAWIINLIIVNFDDMIG